MTFERTRDMRLVRRVMTHPKIFRHITDDGSPAVADYQPPDAEAFWYILCWDGEELLGLWLLTPRNSVMGDIHTCLLPGHGFERARQAARELARWIFANTACRRIVSSVPAYNRAAAQFAKAAGMEEYARNERSYLKFGKLWDLLEFGLSPEDL